MLPDERRLELHVRIIIVVGGLVFRWMVNRAIDRIVRRASQGTVPGVIAGSNGVSNQFVMEVFRHIWPAAFVRRKAMSSVHSSPADSLL